MADQAAVVTLPFTVVPANRSRQLETSGLDVGHFVFTGAPLGTDGFHAFHSEPLGDQLSE